MERTVVSPSRRRHRQTRSKSTSCAERNLLPTSDGSTDRIPVPPFAHPRFQLPTRTTDRLFADTHPACTTASVPSSLLPVVGPTASPRTFAKKAYSRLRTKGGCLERIEDTFLAWSSKPRIPSNSPHLRVLRRLRSIDYQPSPHLRCTCERPSGGSSPVVGECIVLYPFECLRHQE